MKECKILGDRSAIAQGLIPFLQNDGYHVSGWNRDIPEKYLRRYSSGWDLLICAIGSVAPVGHWSKVSKDAWEDSVHTNCILPFKLLHDCWHSARPNASVCFLAGANPNRAGVNYSAYYTGKMALLKMIENIDAETPEAKFFALAPGIVFTKIHQPTYDSGIVNQGLEDRRKVGGTPIQKIYDCLKWCVEQPKNVVGGRNICTSDDWDKSTPRDLPTWLRTDNSMFKLRRVE